MVDVTQLLVQLLSQSRFNPNPHDHMPLQWQHIPSLRHILRTTCPQTRLFASLVMPEAPKRTRRFTEDEIAEDSEPERAEVRRKQRKAKTTPRRVVCNDPNTSEATQKPVLNPFTTEVIEISGLFRSPRV